MTPTDLRAVLKALGLSLGAFAALTGHDPTTVSYWGRERPGRGMQATPAWVPLLLGAWMAHPKLLAEVLERGDAA